jgi:hypothetical protein
VHVDVFAPVDGGDEAISFGIVEPLDCSLEGEREADEAGGEEEFGEVHVSVASFRMLEMISRDGDDVGRCVCV